MKMKLINIFYCNNMSGTLYIRRPTNGVNLELSTSSTFSPLITTTSITTNGQDEYSELDTLWSNAGNSVESITALSKGFTVNVDSSVYDELGITYIRLRDINDEKTEIELVSGSSTTEVVDTSFFSRFFILTDEDGTPPATRIHYKIEINALYIKRISNNLVISNNSAYTNSITASSTTFNGDSSTVYNDYVTTWGSNGDTDLTSYSLRQGFDIIVDSSVYHAIAYLSVRLRDSNNNTTNISLTSASEFTATANSLIDAPFFILSDNDSSTPAIRIHFHISILCVAPFTKIPKIVEIKDVAVGDIIRTSRGDLPIAHIMKTQTTNNKEYVKFEKGCLGPNLPSDDFYVTEQHPLSLGFYKNELLNEGQYDDKEDDYIMLQIATGELVGRLPGITKVKRDFGHYYNLVFDEHTSIDMEGIDVCSHHPRTGPFFLPRDKYIDSSKIDEKKIDKKITEPKFIRFNDLLIRHKPKDIDLKEFLASCLTSDLNKKRQIFN